MEETKITTYLIGSMALNYYAEPRMTRDIDSKELDLYRFTKDWLE